MICEVRLNVESKSGAHGTTGKLRCFMEPIAWEKMPAVMWYEKKRKEKEARTMPRGYTVKRKNMACE